MKHFETHPSYVEGCYGCKLTTISGLTAALAMEREGRDITGGEGTKAYVDKMYADARAAGKPDPIPENSKAAAYAPAAGVLGNTKEYRRINGY